MKDFLESIGIATGFFTPSKILLALITLFSPIFYVCIGIWSLVTIDMITGIIASYKKKIPITSARGSSTIFKLISYMLLIVASLITDKIIEFDMFMNICIFFVAVQELFSIGENFATITGLNIVQYIKTTLSEKLKGINKKGE